MHARKLPNLSPTQVIDLQDELLGNADRLLVSALAVLELGNAALARSLAILGMEESGKAIAIHERRVEMAYAPEGEPFVNARLVNVWWDHVEKLKLVHRFLVEERYWFGTDPADPEANLAYLGAIERWTRRHNGLKLRGFYVDIDMAGGVLAPAEAADRESLSEVIIHVHQIGWQIRLGEHIEAKSQAEEMRGALPMSEIEIEEMREMISDVSPSASDEEFWESMRQGRPGRTLNNDSYRLHLRAPEDHPFQDLDKPGYEAQTRELLRLAAEHEQAIPPPRTS